MFLRTRREVDHGTVQIWIEYWLPRFAKGQGPGWVSEWCTIEKLDEFSIRRQMSVSEWAPPVISYIDAITVWKWVSYWRPLDISLP